MPKFTHLPHLCLLALLWVCSVPLACLSGPLEFSFTEVMHLLGTFLGIIPLDTQRFDAMALLVVGELRFARVILALLCGGALALAGVTLQGVLRNPLADPFTLGISAGAACGASIAITYGGTLTTLIGSASIALIPMGGITTFAAFLGALFALVLTLSLGQSSFSATPIGNGTGRGLHRESVILAGIAVSTFLGAIVTLIKALHEESVTSIVFWIMGSFQGVTWSSAPVVFVPVIIGGFLLLFHWRDLDVLSLGQRQALHLGMDVGRVRFTLLLGASCMAAGCVAVAGIIAFVGLVVPHILRLWLGSAHGPLLIGAWFAGGLLLLWADVVARTLLPDGQELPVGVVMALLGGPFFAMLVRQKRHVS